MHQSYKYIAIEGNIGAGKTTLSRFLAHKTGAQLLLEEFADNPFLANFYANPDRYSFPLELSFLEERYRQQAEALKTTNGNLIADYLWEKSYVFASVNLSGHEFELFQRFYRLLAGQLRHPDLVIYLHRSTERLKKQIGERGRSYEHNIPDEYLNKVSASYKLFCEEEQRMPVLQISENDEFPLDPGVLGERILKIISTEWTAGFHQIDTGF
ncbi:MAG: deoxynucleoside kinase [Bacteroidia bacterium]